ncbi:MAG: hypothetical protein M3Y30_04085 [Gemmatimonadota bacterium]|nr:hypothetical protein [Gemmatimonadota bacterium]
MRLTSLYTALPVAVAMLTACDSSTGQHACNLPTETAYITTFTPSVDGVVKNIKVGGVGNTPGGYDPWTQVDVFVSIPVNSPAGHATVDIVLGKGIPVLVQGFNDSPVPTSACSVRVGDKVTVWAPLQSVFDDPNASTDSFVDAAFVAQKMVIDRTH